jgi:hypothetical protein
MAVPLFVYTAQSIGRQPVFAAIGFRKWGLVVNKHGTSVPAKGGFLIILNI